MKSEALQQLIKKLFGDEQARSEFKADPNRVISRYALTEEEKRAVLATHSRMGMVTTGSQAEATLTAAAWTAPTN